MLLRSLRGARDRARSAELPRVRRPRGRLRGARLALERHVEPGVSACRSGPAAVITPWNAPFMLSTWKTAPALAAGCTVVLKPAEWSPLSCSLLADLVEEAELPPGVFNLVQGIGEEAGAALVAHPLVRRVSFTGSPETGRLIGVSAARATSSLHGGARRQGPVPRVRGRRSRCGRPESRRPVRRRGPGVSRRNAPLDRGKRRRDASWRSSTTRSIGTSWVTRETTRRRFRRSSTPTTSPAWRASSSGPARPATGSCAAASEPSSAGSSTSRP